MMTVSRGAFFSAEWKSGCVLPLMAAGTQGVAEVGDEEARKKAESRNVGEIFCTHIRLEVPFVFRVLSFKPNHYIFKQK